eukprot:scaffold1768_cov116-Isochrysis_galbana.AAC.10
MISCAAFIQPATSRRVGQPLLLPRGSLLVRPYVVLKYHNVRVGMRLGKPGAEGGAAGVAHAGVDQIERREGLVLWHELCKGLRAAIAHRVAPEFQCPEDRVVTERRRERTGAGSADPALPQIEGFQHAVLLERFRDPDRAVVARA